MTQPIPSSPGAARLSLLQRYTGVLFSPRATFESVVSYPTWLGMMLLTIGIVVAVLAVMLLNPTGQQMFLDQMAERTPPDQLAKIAPFVKVIIGVWLASFPVVILVVLFALSGILLGVFSVTGGTAAYRQVLAVVVHAGVVFTVTTLVSAIVNYMRQNLTSATNLAVFMPNVDEHSFLGGFLGTIDLLFFWWLFVLALGIGVLYRRRTQPIFLAFVAVYLLVACGVGAFRVVRGG